MKYTPRLYAQALAEALSQRAGQEEKERMIRNFLRLVRKNGDERGLNKIVAEAENLLLEKSGRRKVLLESARPLSDKQKKLIHKTLQTGDVVEEKVSPELVAGVKITVNEGLQWDGTLQRKLKKMFA